MAVKICDLAKELGVKNEDILDQLRRLYVEAEDETSEIDNKIAGLVRIKLGGVKAVIKPSKPKKEKPKKAVATKPVKESPSDKSSQEFSEKPEKKILEKEEIFEKKSENQKPKDTVDDLKESASGNSKKKDKTVKETVEFDLTGEKPSKFKVSKKRHKSPKFRAAIEIVERAPGDKTKKSEAGSFMPEVKIASDRKTRPKIAVQFPISVRGLAPRINSKPNLIIKYLMSSGVVANINQDLGEEIVRKIMEYFGYELEIPKTIESMEKELVSDLYDTDRADLVPRAPVVTFMGHVDHGKTSLLDYIRKTMVTKGEKGGITQHIGAYKVETASGAVTFLDTPGHAAFTAMRARGAHATDVVVLVVAADDGVMPQTKEAIDHARAAKVPIVVAINKCDLPGANPDKVKADLQKEKIVAESWGGDAIMVEVSARTGEGVNRLVEMLMLESEMLELKANPKLRARGVVIEGKKTPGQGVVATLLVQNGTLRPGDIVLCGSYYGKLKAMMNDKGARINEASPATPVEILGLSGVPEAGEEFFVVKDEKKAKTLSLLKYQQNNRKNTEGNQHVTLEDLYSRIKEGSIKELRIILKADVQGSVEALKHSLEELATSEVKVKIIHDAVGDINESDVMLAIVSNALIIGFHVKINNQAEEMSKSEKLDVHIYDIIYEAIADVKAGMEGLLEPVEREIFHGRAQIKEIFSAKNTKIAGCAVIKGTVYRRDRVRVKRGQETVFEGEIDALKRFKDDVKEVRETFECGISIKGFNDVRKNDVLETFAIEKIARRLEK
ncbi:MAG: translation initiation factor IF-2 [Candidatus Omnitrophota bacterium]